MWRQLLAIGQGFHGTVAERKKCFVCCALTHGSVVTKSAYLIVLVDICIVGYICAVVNGL